MMPRTIRRGNGNQENARSDARVALLVGFRPGLETAIAGLLEEAGVVVLRLPVISEADRVTSGRVPDLLVTSDRCNPDLILRLVASYGTPRRTRVIVLLAGRNAETERIYRDAGLRAILTMPVSAQDLIKAGQLLT